MLNLNSILVFSENPKELAHFYKKVFQKEPDWADQDYYGFSVGKGSLTVGPHDEVHGENTNPQRIMFNLETKDVEEEFERIKKAGAKIIAKPYKASEDPKMWIATLADLDNNYFQLVSPWEE